MNKIAQLGRLAAQQMYKQAEIPPNLTTPKSSPPVPPIDIQNTVMHPEWPDIEVRESGIGGTYGQMTPSMKGETDYRSSRRDKPYQFMDPERRSSSFLHDLLGHGSRQSSGGETLAGMGEDAGMLGLMGLSRYTKGGPGLGLLQGGLDLGRAAMLADGLGRESVANPFGHQRDYPEPIGDREIGQ
jgi:hypothetical protein